MAEKTKDRLVVAGGIALVSGMFALLAVVVLPTIFVLQQNYEAFTFWVPWVYLIARLIAPVIACLRIARLLTGITLNSVFNIIFGIPFDLYMMLWGYPILQDIYIKAVQVPLPTLEFQRLVVFLFIYFSYTRTLDTFKDDGGKE